MKDQIWARLKIIMQNLPLKSRRIQKAPKRMTSLAFLLNKHKNRKMQKPRKRLKMQKPRKRLMKKLRKRLMKRKLRKMEAIKAYLEAKRMMQKKQERTSRKMERMQRWRMLRLSKRRGKIKPTSILTQNATINPKSCS